METWSSTSHVKLAFIFLLSSFIHNSIDNLHVSTFAMENICWYVFVHYVLLTKAKKFKSQICPELATGDDVAYAYSKKWIEEIFAQTVVSSAS